MTEYLVTAIGVQLIEPATMRTVDLTPEMLLEDEVGDGRLVIAAKEN